MFPERLAKGYRTFLGGRFAAERARYQDLAGSGQSPSIMVIGCVDSRVSPEVIFDAAPGELLVARNVANLVPRYEPGGGQHGGREGKTNRSRGHQEQAHGILQNCGPDRSKAYGAR